MSIFLKKYRLWQNTVFGRKCKFKSNFFLRTTGFCSGTPTFYSEDSLPKDNDQFMPLLKKIQVRKAEAKRSIVVQVQSLKSFNELHTYCSQFGTIKNIFHYCVGIEPMHFILVEFTNDTDVHSLLKNCVFLNDGHIVPTSSNFLWFRAPSKHSKKLKVSKNTKLSAENGTTQLGPADLKKLLKACTSISSQIQALYDVTKLTDVETRLRFITAQQIEECVKGIFPLAEALPFGSSVNGFGKMGCDLDLVLSTSNTKDSGHSRLVFQCKGSTGGSERLVSQRNMESIGDLIQLFLPGCSQVRRILHATVPIIKYYQQLADVECDLSMTNTSGVHMSDLLYIMGSIDERVKPLVFTIRKWAREVGLTNPSPGRWITNFPLTLLVLSFLQRPLRSSSILPSLNFLIKSADSTDQCISDDGLRCKFLRDINKLQFESENHQDLESLLIEFFEYYSEFDFSSKALCLNEAITKPDHSPLYIVNPLDRGLNVSRNVSMDEVEKFKSEAKTAAWLLQSEQDKNGNWGLLSLFDTKRRTQFNSNFVMSRKSERLMDVSSIFNESEESESIKFKNVGVKKQVQDIKKETQNQIKKLKNIDR